jgi:hypothetical protein
MADEEPTLNIPFLLTLAVVSFFVIRWFLSSRTPGSEYRRPAGRMSRHDMTDNRETAGFPTPNQQFPGQLNAVDSIRIQEQELEMIVLNSISISSLYVVLSIRANPSRQDNFRWGFYLCKGRDQRWMYNVRGFGSGWIADHEPMCGVLKSSLLCTTIQIATELRGNEEAVDQAIQSLDSGLNNIKCLSSEKWEFLVLEKPVEVGAVHCRDLKALREECMGIGNKYRAGALLNTQPRPIVKSKLCH